jgi:hypothetical protein
MSSALYTLYFNRKVSEMSEDIYYRDFDSENPASSVAKIIVAAASRCALSMIRSLKYASEEIQDRFFSLLTPSVLWSFCLILVGWLIASVIGGAVGAAVNALLLAYGLYQIWEDLKAVWDNLKAWPVSFWNAKNDAELEEAAKQFAVVLGTGGWLVIEAVITHKAFKTVSRALEGRFKPPKASEREFQRAKERREQSKARQVLETAKAGAKARGAEDLARKAEIPTAIIVGGVAAVAVAGVLAWAASSGSDAGATREP